MVLSLVAVNSMTIQAVLTPLIPHVAPTNKKLLLYAVRVVEKRNTCKTIVMLVFSLLMTVSRLTAASSGFKIQNKASETLSENQ